MKIKVISSFAVARGGFSYGQILECPEAVGARLIANHIAEAVPDSAEAEGFFDDETPKEERAILPAKKAPEKATKGAAPETATTGAQPLVDVCQGHTKLGNPCARAPLLGSQFCAAHQSKED